MKKNEWKKLTKDQKNVMVAELAGWERGPTLEKLCGILPMSCWHRKSEEDCAARCSEEDCCQDNPPSFVTDLNAMHEAESTMKHSQFNDYDTLLWNMCGGATGKTGAIHATAEQRAEAFVMTMEKK